MYEVLIFIFNIHIDSVVMFMTKISSYDWLTTFFKNTGFIFFLRQNLKLINVMIHESFGIFIRIKRNASIMNFAMVSLAIYYLQIINRVIKFIAVFMMNYFILKQGTSEMLLHNQAMEQPTFSVDGGSVVSIFSQGGFIPLSHIYIIEESGI